MGTTGKQPLAAARRRTNFADDMRKLFIACFVLSLTVACARSDLGSPCHLLDAAGAEVLPQPGREYFYLGSSECESFTCLATPGVGSPYCSQACAGPGASCPAGLACGSLSLNTAYLDTMRQRLSAKEFDGLFGQVTSSYYCVRGR
jgi:hypothetical protein